MINVFSIISRFFNTIMLILSEKVIVSSKAFKYPRYKKVFIDENPKTGFSDMTIFKKLQR